jgi:predicted ribosome quality control (RQC) complex YloA/Tae2 family protein
MTRNVLVSIAKRLSNYKKIYAIDRVDDNVIRISFDGTNDYFFNMQKGDSHIYKNDNFKRTKIYKAPFDVTLTKRFTNAFVTDVEVLEGDKILRIKSRLLSNYKEVETILQFEFTGRYTNAIILDCDEIVIEALRHIDISTSFREVKAGVKLKHLPPPPFKRDESKDTLIENLDEYLYNEFIIREKRRVESLKRQKISQIDKKIRKLKRIFDSLESEEELMQKATKSENIGSLILANMQNINLYDKRVKLVDFEGKSVEVEIPKEAKSLSMAADIFFQRAKKFKQKAKNISIERDNLSGKIEFLQRLKVAVESAKSSKEIEIYFPKLQGDRKREVKEGLIENFYIRDYKISVGKNQRGNIKLLKDAKMSDIWMHLKDIPSTHVIITNRKKSIPQDILEFGAKLCVDFSTKERGSYLVDWAFRRDVKVRDGANVNYVNYKSIKVVKE